MANNRMWVACKVCGRRVLMFRYYPQTWWYIVTPDPNDALFEHAFCSNEQDEEEVFELVYEGEKIPLPREEG